MPILAAAFLSPLENKMDNFKENVNIVVQDLKENPLSLDEYSETAIKQMKAVFELNMKILDQGPTYLSGRPAYRLIYLGKAGKWDYKFMYVWTIVNDKAYQFNFTALSTTYNDYIRIAKKMMRSFKIY